MNSLFQIIAFLTCFSHVLSSPDQSPLCNANFAAAEMKRFMGTSVALPSVSLVASKSSFSPGDQIQLTLETDRSFAGLLLYATPASNMSMQVGTFDIPTGFQNNDFRCKRSSEFPNSVVTHTLSQNYNQIQTFNYKTSNVYTDDLTFGVIVVQLINNKYAYNVVANALQLKANSVTATGTLSGASYTFAISATAVASSTFTSNATSPATTTTAPDSSDSISLFNGIIKGISVSLVLTIGIFVLF